MLNKDHSAQADKKIVVFTDGSSRGNPGPGGWGAIIATANHVYELSGSAINTTNNRMELTAVLRSLLFLVDNKQAGYSVVVNTDSQYFKNGFESWMYGWADRGWLTAKKEPVLNQDLWEELLAVKPLFSDLVINHVRGHVGVAGNERADVLATEAADNQLGVQTKSLRSKYSVDLKAVTSSTEATKKRERKKRSGPAYCYLSMVNGKISEHQTWAECQQRTSGQSGAKYRRADSIIEKTSIINEWQSE